MKVNKKVLVILILLIVGVLLLRLQPIKVSNNQAIPAYSISSDDFIDEEFIKSLTKEEPRLITVEEFHASKLDNYRDLYIYLPPSYYDDTSKSYPVLYIQDGKGVFYLSDWSKESLELHLKADKLINKGNIEEIIVVGISNMGNQRDSEFAHWDGVERGQLVKGKGGLYEDFLIHDVKPFVERNFRIKLGRENTAIMGSSLGGFVSFNIAMRNPEAFSKIAMQSPYLGWGEERLIKEIKEGEYNTKKDMKIWMDMGSEETKFLNVMRVVIKDLLAQGYEANEELAVFEVPKGKHSEGSWAERVEDILLYFYGEKGKPFKLKVVANDKPSLSQQTNGVYKHINPILTYDNGMRISDFTGEYIVDDDSVIEVGDLGTVDAKKKGTVNLTYKTYTGLSDTVIITVVR